MASDTRNFNDLLQVYRNLDPVGKIKLSHLFGQMAQKNPHLSDDQRAEATLICFEQGCDNILSDASDDEFNEALAAQKIMEEINGSN